MYYWFQKLRIRDTLNFLMCAETSTNTKTARNKQKRESEFNQKVSCVRCHMSCVICHMSHVMCHVSYVMCHMQHVTCHVSHVRCHMSFFMCQVLSVACHLSPCHLKDVITTATARTTAVSNPQGSGVSKHAQTDWHSNV